MISAILEQPAPRSYTMAAAIADASYYHVAIPGWASGGWDVGAQSSPAEAALTVGGYFKFYGWQDCPDRTKVYRHLPSSRIGATVLDDLGEFPTANEFGFDI